MDLIYMNAEREDIGVLHNYEFDLAFGNDENSFECVIDRNSHCCDFGFYLYIEGTEYGGIIDSVESKNSTQEVVYSGRTWHGVLNSKVLEPASGDDYLVCSGEANAVLGDLVSKMGLSDLFVVSKADSGLTIKNYKMNRYINGYDGIMKMLKTVDGKLRLCNQSNGQVLLSAVPIVDYTQDGLDSDLLDLDVKRTSNTVNHLICLGSGNLSERMVVHLYVDENGNISRTQTISGVDEYVAVFEYSNAEDEADLVSSGTDRLKELMQQDDLSVDVNDVGDPYDVGDLVGATDNIANISVKVPITRKIVTIKNGMVTIDIKTDTNSGSAQSNESSSGGSDGQPGQDGKDGQDGVSCTHEWNGTVLTITSASGTSSADLKGDKGDKGEPGIPGVPGEPGKDGQDGSFDMANPETTGVFFHKGNGYGNTDVVFKIQSNNGVLTGYGDASSIFHFGGVPVAFDAAPHFNGGIGLTAWGSSITGNCGAITGFATGDFNASAAGRLTTGCDFNAYPVAEMQNFVAKNRNINAGYGLDNNWSYQAYTYNPETAEWDRNFGVRADGKVFSNGVQLATLADVDNASGGGGASAFYAQYGTTTFAEIKAAYAAGSPVYVVKDNSVYTMSDMWDVFAVFTYMTSTGAGHQELRMITYVGDDSIGSYTSDSNKFLTEDEVNAAIEEAISSSGGGGISVDDGLTFPATKGIEFITPGTTKGRMFTLPNVPDWVGWTLNAQFNGAGWVLDDPNKAGWFFKLDSRSFMTEFAAYYIPPGAGVHTDEYAVFAVKPDGTITSRKGELATKADVSGGSAEAMTVEQIRAICT